MVKNRRYARVPQKRVGVLCHCGYDLHFRRVIKQPAGSGHHRAVLGCRKPLEHRLGKNAGWVVFLNHFQASPD